jgi:hypothetical protein
MEIMYAAYGVGASTAILLDGKDDRWDVMYQFIPTLLHSDKEINSWLNQPVCRFLVDEKMIAKNPEWSFSRPLRSGQFLKY